MQSSARQSFLWFCHSPAHGRVIRRAGGTLWHSLSPSCSMSQTCLPLHTLLFPGAPTYGREQTCAYLFALSHSMFSGLHRVLTAQLAGIMLAFRSPFKVSTKYNFPWGIPSSTRTRITGTLCLLSLLSVLATLFHCPAVGPRPFKPGTRTFNAGIWTVHFGIDNGGHDSQRRIRDLIRYAASVAFMEFVNIWFDVDRDMELDVVGLLETDLHVSMNVVVRAQLIYAWISGRCMEIAICELCDEQ